MNGEQTTHTEIGSKQGDATNEILMDVAPTFDEKVKRTFDGLGQGNDNGDSENRLERKSTATAWVVAGASPQTRKGEIEGDEVNDQTPTCVEDRECALAAETAGGGEECEYVAFEGCLAYEGCVPLSADEIEIAKLVGQDPSLDYELEEDQNDIFAMGGGGCPDKNAISPTTEVSMFGNVWEERCARMDKRKIIIASRHLMKGAILNVNDIRGPDVRSIKNETTRNQKRRNRVPPDHISNPHKYTKYTFKTPVIVGSGKSKDDERDCEVIQPSELDREQNSVEVSPTFERKSHVYRRPSKETKHKMKQTELNVGKRKRKQGFNL